MSDTYEKDHNLKHREMSRTILRKIVWRFLNHFPHSIMNTIISTSNRIPCTPQINNKNRNLLGDIRRTRTTEWKSKNNQFNKYDSQKNKDMEDIWSLRWNYHFLYSIVFHISKKTRMVGKNGEYYTWIESWVAHFSEQWIWLIKNTTMNMSYFECKIHASYTNSSRFLIVSFYRGMNCTALSKWTSSSMP